jgi:hypothetical protein
MHFEVPKAKTFKEFGGEYVMIVISILTALALEAGVEKMHHDHLAREATEQINAELRTNVADIKKVLAHNEEKQKALMAAREQMLAALQARVDDKEFIKRFDKEWHTAVNMSLQTPSLRREAWEAAVASQAVTWMPHASLEKYANSYAEMRDVNALFNGGTISFLDAPRMQDVFSDMQIGIGDPRAVFRTVTQMINAYGSLDGNLKSLQRDLENVTAAAERGES